MIDNKAKAAAKVDALLAESFANDDERLQRIVQQAQAESLRRNAEKPMKNQKKRLWRGVPALCTLLIVLVVAPLFASICNPVSTGEANQFLRKAVVWINNTFHMNIELPVQEIEEELLAIDDIVTFKTAQEASDYLGKNILVLDNSSGCELQSIEVSTVASFLMIKQEYLYKGEKISLSLESTVNNTISVSQENAQELICSAGTLWSLTMGDKQRALGYIDEWTVNMYTTLESTVAEKIFLCLNWLN